MSNRDNVQSPYSVLVIEDDVTYGHLMEAILGRAGYDVCVVSSAVEAFEVLKSKPDISLIITDASLPGGMNGFQFIKLAIVRGYQMPMILMTGLMTDEGKVYAANVGASRYILKPADYRVMLSCIDEVLKGL